MTTLKEAFCLNIPFLGLVVQTDSGKGYQSVITTSVTPAAVQIYAVGMCVAWLATAKQYSIDNQPCCSLQTS